MSTAVAPLARLVEDRPHAFEKDDHGSRWCRLCGRSGDAYVHASEAERAAFDATRVPPAISCPARKGVSLCDQPAGHPGRHESSFGQVHVTWPA